jgi:TolA-binding protein
MKANPCPRLFEAEAIRDGRVAGAELASFARHSAVCPACRREVQALDELAGALRAGTQGGANDGAQTDELRTARARTRLIAAFDQTLRSEGRPADRALVWRWALWPAAAVALVAGVLLWGRTRPAPTAGTSAGLVVEPGAAAVWSKRSDGDRERVVLDQGALRIQVDHSRHQTKLVVALPDGELEDIGTTFTVSVANGRTTRVAVQEGIVVLRIRGAAPVALAAGAVWLPEPPRPAAPAATVSPGPPNPLPSAMASPPRARSPIVSRTAKARPVGAPDAPDPGVAFRAAVAVLETGAHREAAAAFARFLVEHPRDPRAEDAAYLRVIALQRCGAAQETRRAAQAYLQLYPTGFRRTEIEKLSPPVQSSPTESAP